jgi:hypothetical protein
VLTIAQEPLFALDDMCQRWSGGADAWVPDDGGVFDARRYTVREIDKRVARGFVTEHHYSKSYPADRQRFGMFEGRHLVGVAVLGQPMHNQVTGKVFPTLDRMQAAELSRFVLLDEVPGNAETWLLARVYRLAAADGLRGVVAFSDPKPRRTTGGLLQFRGHLGGIYRAGAGATGRYTGRGTARTLTLLPDGRVFSARTRAKITGWERGGRAAAADLVALGAPEPIGGVGALAGMSADERGAYVAGALIVVGARNVRHRGNHRFVWAIGGRGARRRTPIALPALPYPTTLDPEG